MSFVKIATEFLMAVKGELDPYTTEKNQVKVKNFFTVELLTPAHVQFARYGRGPGKRPPLDPIIKWVQQKKIGPQENTKGTAFAIANSISKNGTSNYVKGAPNFLEESIRKHMDVYLDKLSEGYIKTQNEKHMQQMKQLFEDGLTKSFQFEITPRGGLKGK